MLYCQEWVCIGRMHKIVNLRFPNTQVRIRIPLLHTEMVDSGVCRSFYKANAMDLRQMISTFLGKCMYHL